MGLCWLVAAICWAGFAVVVVDLNAPLFTPPGVGHFPFLERPDEVNARIVRFLTS
jgi:pimeloyl-ACP methyl ester carboxylesterase